LAGLGVDVVELVGAVTLRALQALFRDTYFRRDAQRGPEKTFLWLVSELGEAAEAFKDADREQLASELADVTAWLLSFCNVADIDLERAVLERYGRGCPRCSSIPCVCG